MKPLVLWIAQGFGVGRIPFAPGTFGSILGLGWFALLLWPGNLWVYFAGTLAGLILSVWFCGQGEKILNQTDPGCIVLDEVTAIPIGFAAFLVAHYYRTGALPAPTAFFSRNSWLIPLTVFALFRFFDIVKPWPVRQSQALPGGWGVTVDDVLAAVLTTLTAYALLMIFGKHTVV